jgi:ParB family chromosome partitioning protein
MSGEKQARKAAKGRRALGRGLDALLPSKAAPEPARGSTPGTFECPIERIEPRRDQPRQHFAPDELEALAHTIREHGVLQPIVVRRVASGADRYEIIAGERRWRAVQKAGLKEIPVVVKDVSDDAAFELALVENLQRQDLNAIEVAEAYARLLDHHTQEQVAERVGKSRTAVTNSLRLLKLPAKIRGAVVDGKLSEGHARALLGAPDAKTMTELADKVLRGRVSVRAVEKMVRSAKQQATAGDKPSPPKNANVRDLEERLTRRLGSRTQVKHHGKSGQLVIRYADLDELDRILDVIGA